MRERQAIGLIVLALLLASCGPAERVEKRETIARVASVFEIEICDGTKLVSTNANPPWLRGKGLVVAFPDRRCTEDFYRAMEAGSAQHAIVDDKVYSRVIGARGEPPTLFAINRLTETTVYLGYFESH